MPLRSYDQHQRAHRKRLGTIQRAVRIHPTQQLITYAKHSLNTSLPKQGAPVASRLNHSRQMHSALLIQQQNVTFLIAVRQH
jgi:hypothetical protein